MECRIFILAAGRSTRMGRNKAYLELGGETVLGFLQRRFSAVASAGLSTIEVDLHPGQGPLGGFETALSRSQSEENIFLACDMPFIPISWVECLRFQNKAGPHKNVFTRIEDRVGFPCLLLKRSLERVVEHLSKSEKSLQSLARSIPSIALSPPPEDLDKFLNFNTPEEWEKAQKLFVQGQSKGDW
jgi:molybdenum cofactor guanylyltransferase